MRILRRALLGVVAAYGLLLIRAGLGESRRAWFGPSLTAAIGDGLAAASAGSLPPEFPTDR